MRSRRSVCANKRRPRPGFETKTGAASFWPRPWELGDSRSSLRLSCSTIVPDRRVRRIRRATRSPRAMLKAIKQNPPLSNIGNGTRLRRSQSHQDTLLSRYASIWDERPGFRRRNPLGTCRNRGPSTRRVGSRGPQDKPRSRRMSTVGEPGQTQDPRTRAKSLLQDQQKISSLQTPPASPTAGGCRGSKDKSVTQRCSAVARKSMTAMKPPVHAAEPNASLTAYG